MVDWKLYIDSPQKRALDRCGGTFDDGEGWGDGCYGWGAVGAGNGSGDGNVDGYGNGEYAADGWGGGDGKYFVGHGSGGSAKRW